MNDEMSTPLKTTKSRDRLKRPPLHGDPSWADEDGVDISVKIGHEGHPMNSTARYVDLHESEIGHTSTVDVSTGLRVRRAARKPSTATHKAVRRTSSRCTPNVSIIERKRVSDHDEGPTKVKVRYPSEDEVVSDFGEDRQPDASKIRLTTASAGTSITPACPQRAQSRLKLTPMWQDKSKRLQVADDDASPDELATRYLDWRWVFLTTLVCWTVVLHVYTSNGFFKHSPPELQADANVIWLPRLHSLTNLFPTQSDIFWSAVNKTVSLATKSIGPAVLILVHTDDQTRATATSLASALAKALNGDQSASETIQSGQVKSTTELDSHLRYQLSVCTRLAVDDFCICRSAFVADLDLMDGVTAMALHYFCDESESPHRDAVLIFTVRVESTSVDKSKYNLDYNLRLAVETKLQSVWSASLDNDSLYSVISRVVDVVLLVNP